MAKHKAHIQTGLVLIKRVLFQNYIFFSPTNILFYLQNFKLNHLYYTSYAGGTVSLASNRIFFLSDYNPLFLKKKLQIERRQHFVLSSSQTYQISSPTLALGSAFSKPMLSQTYRFKTPYKIRSLKGLYLIQAQCRMCALLNTHINHTPNIILNKQKTSQNLLCFTQPNCFLKAQSSLIQLEKRRTLSLYTHVAVSFLV